MKLNSDRFPNEKKTIEEKIEDLIEEKGLDGFVDGAKIQKKIMKELIDQLPKGKKAIILISEEKDFDEDYKSLALASSDSHKNTTEKLKIVRHYQRAIVANNETPDPELEDLKSVVVQITKLVVSLTCGIKHMHDNGIPRASKMWADGKLAEFAAIIPAELAQRIGKITGLDLADLMDLAFADDD